MGGTGGWRRWVDGARGWGEAEDWGSTQGQGGECTKYELHRGYEWAKWISTQGGCTKNASKGNGLQLSRQAASAMGRHRMGRLDMHMRTDCMGTLFCLGQHSCVKPLYCQGPFSMSQTRLCLLKINVASGFLRMQDPHPAHYLSTRSYSLLSLSWHNVTN